MIEREWDLAKPGFDWTYAHSSTQGRALNGRRRRGLAPCPCICHGRARAEHVAGANTSRTRHEQLMPSSTTPTRAFVSV
jgi:hypothetical protein